VAPLGAMIWLYMDFTKYVSMLEHGGLYLRRSDLLGDPFEGSVSQLNLQAERCFLLAAICQVCRRTWPKIFLEDGLIAVVRFESLYI
jgi:hypothetical protein